MKKKSVILCLILFCSILVGCQSSINSGWAEGLDGEGLVRGSKNIGTDCIASVHEMGAFYTTRAGLLSYYDYDSDECYILCSAPNCGHGSGECMAFAGMDATGFGIHGSCGYFLRPCESAPHSMWELVCVDMEEQTVRVLCSIGSEGIDVDQWWCIGVEEVYYNRGYAWLEVSMYYHAAESTNKINGKQLLAIDLETGGMTELTPFLSVEAGYGKTCFEYFDQDHAAIYMLRYDIPCLTLEEYRAQYGDFPEVTYEDYLNQYFAEVTQSQQHILVDIATMEQTVIRDAAYDQPEQLAWIESTEPVYWMSESLGDGKYNTWFRSVDSEGKLVERGNFTGSDLLGWYAGGMLPQYDDNSYLYVNDAEPSARQMWRYRIDSGESTYLFDFTNDTLFNLFGQTEDKLVGMLNGNTQYAWIYKSDYEKGNFDALHRFTLK